MLVRTAYTVQNECELRIWRYSSMTVQDTIKSLREKHGLSQDQLAERVMVTRQAVSRWETGETQPNTDTLQLLSKEFDVSINTLLGKLSSLHSSYQFFGLSREH